MGIRDALRRFLTIPEGFFSFPDGLDIAPYVEAVERKFNLRLSKDDCSKLWSLGDLCDLIETHLGENGDSRHVEVIWQLLRELTSDEFGVREEDLNRETRFVDDLGC